jgi:alkylhydroperoxidase family enzyme
MRGSRDGDPVHPTTPPGRWCTMTWVEERDTRGPLLPLRGSKDTDGEVRRLLEKFEDRNNAPDILRVVANSERGFQLWVRAIDALMYRSELPAPDREAAVLRLAASCRSRYEWVEHEQIARTVGLSAEAIEAIAAVDDRTPIPLLTESQNLVITIVDSTLDAGGPGIDDELWSRARATWGDSAAFDLLFCIGWWGGMVPLLIRMFRL